MKLIKKLICLSLPLLCACPVSGQDLPDSFAIYGDGKDPSNNRVRVVDSVCLERRWEGSVEQSREGGGLCLP